MDKIELNIRAVAIRNVSDGVAYIYGEGEIIPGQVPDTFPFNEQNFKNPCIKLDSGKYVWGFQCWWMPLSKWEGQKKVWGVTKEEIIDLEEEVLPKKI